MKIIRTYLSLQLIELPLLTGYIIKDTINNSIISFTVTNGNLLLPDMEDWLFYVKDNNNIKLLRNIVPTTPLIISESLFNKQLKKLNITY